MTGKMADKMAAKMNDKELLKGCDLWIIPDIEESAWRWTLEWSVNFQIAKSLEHQTPALSSEFKHLLTEVESAEMEQPTSSRSPWTMISSEKLLPAKWLLISGKLQKEQFKSSLDGTWNKLGRPSTRIFTSNVWTKDMIEGLKSECVKSSDTEIV